MRKLPLHSDKRSLGLRAPADDNFFIAREHDIEEFPDFVEDPTVDFRASGTAMGTRHPEYTDTNQGSRTRVETL